MRRSRSVCVRLPPVLLQARAFQFTAVEEEKMQAGQPSDAELQVAFPDHDPLPALAQSDVRRARCCAIRPACLRKCVERFVFVSDDSRCGMADNTLGRE